MPVSTPHAFIASSNALVRELLAELLHARFGIRVIGSGESLQELPSPSPVRLIIWDVGAASVHGFEGTKDSRTGATHKHLVRVDGGSTVEDIVEAVREAIGLAPLKFEKLTRHETDVLLAVASGARSSDIARRMRRSVKTIEKHRTSLHRKLGLRSVAQLTAYAIRGGLINADAILAARRGA